MCFNIRRRIQKLFRFNPLTAKRLLAKYFRGEKYRAVDECHKVAKKIVEFAKEHKMGIIMESPKGLRNKIDYGKNRDLRLRSWNLRRLQFYIEYNGHRLLKCRNCRYGNDRDKIACLNMLRMRGAIVAPENPQRTPSCRGKREDENL